MIRLTKKVEQDFLSRSECKRLRDAGIDMSDGKYEIICRDGVDYVASKEDKEEGENRESTYTLPEILYKLNEYPYLGEDYGGPLGFCKDAPFYIWYFDLKGKDGKTDTKESIHEYPIISAAHLLLWSAENNVYYVKDISDK